MAQPRHKRKPLASHQGEVVRVTRMLESGEVIAYDAILELETDGNGNVGRATLEKISFLYACARAGAYEMFLAAIDIPIKGFADWWMISDIPVELSRHNCEKFRGQTYTRQVMDLLGYAPAA